MYTGSVIMSSNSIMQLVKLFFELSQGCASLWLSHPSVCRPSRACIMQRRLSYRSPGHTEAGRRTLCVEELCGTTGEQAASVFVEMERSCDGSTHQSTALEPASDVPPSPSESASPEVEVSAACRLICSPFNLGPVCSCSPVEMDRPPQFRSRVREKILPQGPPEEK